MHPPLTDQAVAGLPLQAGRAELLEEIMSTPVLDDTATADRREPARGTGARTGARTARWLVPVAAAAAVAALATAPSWWPGGDAPLLGGRDGSNVAGSPAGTPATPPRSLDSGHMAVLDDPGWTVENVEREDRYGSIAYARGDQRLEITWYPAGSYAEYVEDREHITEPPSPGEPVQVLGLGGQLWAYSATDHTVIREVQDGHWMEFRGGGMSLQEFRGLLDRLRLVADAGFDAALPAEFSTADERDRAIVALLAEIEGVSGAGLPAGAAPITSTESDPYHLGADVAGGYACRWVEAALDGDPRAADVLATARDWPVLRRMDAEGDYPEVVWEIADDVVAGRRPVEFRQGLGC